MYAASKDELDAATCAILKENNKYPEFVKRFINFYKRKHEWVLFYRKELLTRQNNTNNFAEISIRILKDIVLCRTKAFNVVALCDFCITVWELYLVKRLLEYAHSRKDAVTLLLYSSLLRKSCNFDENQLENIDDDVYIIHSGEKSYTINVEIGACTCPAGISGAFCKHQCFLMHLKKISLPNAPPITQADRHQLAILALGPKCPEISFFGEFQKAEGSSEITSNILESPEIANESAWTSVQEPTILMATPELKETIAKEFQRLGNLVSGEITNDSAQRLLTSLKKIENVGDFKNLFVLKKIGRTKRIKVQPTSIARRQGHIKSSKRLPSGRPPLCSSKKSVKRKRLLSENIKNNTPNAKSHGIGH